MNQKRIKRHNKNHKRNNKQIILRWILFIVGIIILTFGARIILLSDLGVGGLDAIAIGLAERTDKSIGMWIVVLGVLLVIIGSVIRKKITILPLGTSLLVGWFYNLWGIIWFDKMISPTQTANIGYTFLLGILIAPIGAALYISSEVSMGPVDYFMIAVKERFHKSIQIGRTFIEVIFVIIGYFVGGPIGIGTICIMLLWGPILQVYYTAIKRLLDKYLERK
ncbi:MAG: YitT family protein [Cellulosilyticum sp.]|nr:YitT family protein [Cellulosilyticum sp.]